MGKTYSEKLKDPRWQKKRLEVLERDGWTCKKCNDSENTLHIHHISYGKGKEPWEYDPSNLDTLCLHCHDIVTKIIATLKAPYKSIKILKYKYEDDTYLIFVSVKGGKGLGVSVYDKEGYPILMGGILGEPFKRLRKFINSSMEK